MATLLTDVNSVLGIEIGTINTRAVLFDVVEESYQFIAAGIAPTTCGEPNFDAMPGVLEAILKLQDITGRFLLDLNQKLIIPSHGGVEGVDKLLLTLSYGPDLEVVTFGLLNDISLETANRLARTAPVKIVDCFGINDRRLPQHQMDALLNARPKVIIFAGGSDRGATKSVLRMAQWIASALHLLPAEDRPKFLYCGNRSMARRVKELMEKVTIVQITNNVRPEIETEDLNQASLDLNQLITKEKIDTIDGIERIATYCSDKPMLTGVATQRVVRFLGKQYDPARGVLSIDLGSAHTTVAYANAKDSSLFTLPIGSGFGLENALRQSRIADIEKWLPEVLSETQVANYLWQKTLYPASLPVTGADLNIELAMAEQILIIAMHELETRRNLPFRSFEPILVSGSVLTHTASPWQTLLALLNGIQPVGITPLVMDKHGILSLLGASGRTNPLMPVQVLESTAFINLATVVTLHSKARLETPILKARLQTQTGAIHEITIEQGSMGRLPLAFGESGLLFLDPLKKIFIADIEIGKEPIKVKGGVCGLIFDARGRPIHLPADGESRRNLFWKWTNQVSD